MVRFVDFLQQLVNSFHDVSKISLPTLPQHEPDDLVKAVRGIVYQETIPLFVAWTSAWISL